MTSTLWNAAASSALQTLRLISSNYAAANRAASTGLRIETAADNAAYWAVATTMRSDNAGMSAVSDAIGLSMSKIDVASTGLDAVSDILADFKAKLVTANEKGVDKNKIQAELDQYKQQMQSIASSASFNGVNWLQTQDPENLWNLSSLTESLATSLVRSKDGTISIGSTAVDLASISLFNDGGGGALQADPRSLGTIGGLRSSTIDQTGSVGLKGFGFTGPATFSPTDSLSFSLTLNSDPSSPGTSYSITIDKSVVDAALGTTDGVIGSAGQMAAVLSRALSLQSVPANVSSSGSGFFIQTQEVAGVTGSSVTVGSVSSTLLAGTGFGLEKPTIQNINNDHAQPSYVFTSAFRVNRDVAFSFDISANGGATKTISIDRDMVDSALGTTDGKISSAADMAKVLNQAMSGTAFSATSSGSSVVFNMDPAAYPIAGTRSRIQVSNVQDNLDGNYPDFDIADVDITAPGADMTNYLLGIESMSQRVISAASKLGSQRSMLDIQEKFLSSMQDSITSSIGRLVDSDMEETAAKLTALQTQGGLAIQALSIANSSGATLLRLFQ